VTLPAIKSAGGKRKLLPHLLPHIPVGERIGVYAEPFVGGGALFFEIWQRCKSAVLIDANEELINFYRCLRDQPTKLIKYAKRWKYDEKVFYRVRAMKPDQMTAVERAGRFLYLNKTCFNGLWRVNKAGKYNVPFGRYTNPTIVDEKGLWGVSQALQCANVVHGDFTLAARYNPDVVYCDPPYDTLTATADFTSYTAGGFGWADQERLEAWARCEGKGMEHAQVMLSNADTKRIRKLYSRWDWDIQTIEAARAINSKASKRGKVKEVIIT
jgi:DNA adenine methylase